jgi:LysM repeat protein
MGMAGFENKVAGTVGGNAGGQWITYTIQRGDNLTVIGRKFGVSVNDLVAWNNIKNPDLIYAGETLKIKQ